jgi:hypothetical protein
MAALVAGDVAYDIEAEQILDSGYRRRRVKISFGDGSDTYPTGGVPLTAADMGCANEIFSFILEDTSDTGFIYKYDRANVKLKMYYADYDAVADGALVEVANTVAPAAADVYAIVEGW